MAGIRSHGPSGYGFIRKAKEEQHREKQKQMIADYYDFLERRPVNSPSISDHLPHSKDELVEALLNVIANSKSQTEIAHSAFSIMTLANFQESSLPNIAFELSKYGVSSVDDLSPEQTDELFGRIDIGLTTAMVSAHSRDISTFRQEIMRAKELNRHLLPWYVKCWHKFRQQGAYSPFADDFVIIRYPN